jgi:hypothetical protein
MIASAFEGLDRPSERPSGDLELTFCLVHGADDVFALGAEVRPGEAGDAISLTLDRVDDHVELGGSG